MPDIDPAALSRMDSTSQLVSIPLGNSKVNGATAPLSLKTTKFVTGVQRIDLEPIYTSLKSTIGDRWGDYKEAMSLFLLGTFVLRSLQDSAWQILGNRRLRLAATFRSTQSKRALFAD